MKNTALLICAVFSFTVLFAACAKDKEYKKTMEGMDQPVNCATAEGDIRSLNHEKAHVKDEIAQGVTAITPVGLVVGVIHGTEKTKLKVAIGEYNDMIDERIAQIKQECGIH